VKKILWDFFLRYPTPKHLMDATENQLITLLKPLGLIKRVLYIRKMSRGYLEDDWILPIQLYGIGKYANDAYLIFCCGRFQDTDPKDHMLTKYHNKLVKVRPKVDYQNEDGSPLHPIPDKLKKIKDTTTKENQVVSKKQESEKKRKNETNENENKNKKKKKDERTEKENENENEEEENEKKKKTKNEKENKKEKEKKKSINGVKENTKVKNSKSENEKVEKTSQEQKEKEEQQAHKKVKKRKKEKEMEDESDDDGDTDFVEKKPKTRRRKST